MNVRTHPGEAVARASGADWLGVQLAAVSGPGARAARSRVPYRPGEEATAQNAIASVVDAARTLGAERIAAIRAIIARCPDPVTIVQRALAHDALEDVDFFDLLRFCEVVRRARSQQSLPAALRPPDCAPLAEALRPGTRGAAFYLDDAFDAALAARRAHVAQAHAAYESARGRLVDHVARELGRDDIRGDEFIVMREARRGPLPQHVHVVRETPTYFLCAIDLDEGALEALRRRDAAIAAAGEEEDRVRERLTATVRAQAEVIGAAADAVGALDWFMARADFAQRFAAVTPRIVRERTLTFEEARWLPLAESLQASRRPYVPISLELDGVAIITGPNMGGKTAALATCGFVAVCAAWGVPVPARAATTALFGRVCWLSSGAEDAARDALLSSFGKEVIALRDVLEGDLSHALVLVDEFARTTNPLEGRALAIALAQTLRERGAVALLASHLDGVAESAGASHFAVAGLREPAMLSPAQNLQQALGAISEAMDYRIVRVGAEGHVPSDAIALARVLGVDARFIEAACEALGERTAP